MNKISTLILALFVSIVTFGATFPMVSSDGNEVFYYIQMLNGKGVLTSMGNNATVQAAAPNAKKKDVQTWKIIKVGSKYSFVNPKGEMLFYNTSSKFLCAGTSGSGVKEFDIVNSTNSTYKGLEISTGDGTNSFFNQWGGAGIGAKIGLWSKGDPNNPLEFVAVKDMVFKDVTPDAVTEVTLKGIAKWTPTNKHTLWYKKPATVWMTSTLPIGNGQFGGCVMGGVKREDVQFNDKTLWKGHVGSVVSNATYGSYLNFGHLYITSTDKNLKSVTNYRRWLDIDEAKAGVEYTANGIDYKREYICSYPDKVIAIKYSATQKGKINDNVILYNFNGGKPTYSLDNNKGVIVFKGEAERSGTPQNEAYYCKAIITTKGGKIESTEDGINVSNADEMCVYLFGATNFDGSNDQYIYDASLLPNNVDKVANAAALKGYDAIEKDHTADYKALYDRCKLTITNEVPSKPTNMLISGFAINDAKNLLLEEMYFCYGRYLMISCSRGVDLPSNLQGIWNNSNHPAWNSDIHSNINVQMNYWPAEITNLSELHMPYLKYIYREACERPQWRKNAKEIAGQTVGWTLTTENNIYGSGSTWGQNYTIANAWYCMHLWQHYRFTLDKEYLRTIAYPAMRSCSQYWLERLVLASDGTYECPNEYSPEHGPGAENATAHSQQLVWDLFNNTLQAIDELQLNEDDSFMVDLKNKFDKLDKGIATEVVNGKTLLREWKYTSQNNISTYNSHRHMSHLMGLYPGNQIAQDIDPTIYEAAVNSLNTRGYQGTGWSMGWKVNLHARTHNGEICQQLLKTALHSQTNTGNSEGGGVYENLWDAHTPYQIDGNFGACAGMAEMLLQSHLGKLEILPALPSIWKNGQVSGLRAVNNFEVNIVWKENKATAINIISYGGKKAIIKYPNIAKGFNLVDNKGNKVNITVKNDNEIEFDTQVGATYNFTTKDATLGVNNVSINDSEKSGNIVATRYFMINGTEVKKPNTNGLYIASDKYADGTTKTKKIIIK